MDDRIYADEWTSKFALDGAPWFFHLSKYTPDGIDIPNRIRTAERFVREAARFEAITPDAPLLIFGAGVAGVAAALTAAALGIPSTIREMRNVPFPQQALCKTRWVHPNQYAWPNPNYECTEFPADHTPAPLTWRAGFANEIAQDWTKQLEATLAVSNLITIEYEFTVTFPSTNIEDSYVRFLEVNDRDNKFALFLATGFAETSFFDDFRGYPFWSTDCYDAARYGLADSPKTLIAGGGDGALQDLLRIAFRETPLAILSRIKDIALQCQTGTQWWAEVEKELTNVANTRRTRDPAVLRKHAGIYAKLLAVEPDVWKRIASVVKALTRDDFLPRQLQLTFKGQHLPCSYPLNRILAEVLRKYVLEVHNHDVFTPGAELLKIATHEAHDCAKSPADCHGRTHQATYSVKNTATTEQRLFNFIVIRLGRKI